MKISLGTRKSEEEETPQSCQGRAQGGDPPSDCAQGRLNLPVLGFWGTVTG